MSVTTDMELVREFAEGNSEAAFAELVRRYVDLVYSIALRFTGNAADAEDIAQAVFVILARKAGGLRGRAVLTGWMYETTRLAALQFLRNRARQHQHEQEAQMETILQNQSTERAWSQIAPLLEEAMSRLNEKDRALVALRYFENRSAAETAAVLGIGEWAAHKRAARALEKLRKYFSMRGVNSSTEVIADSISANSLQTAPPALTAAITAIALAKGAAASVSTLTLIQGAMKVMAWTKIKTAIVASAIGFCILGGGAVLYVHASGESDPASELKAALRVERPKEGTWSYPSQQLVSAIRHYGTNRANAFPILEEAIKGSNVEARKQAVMGLGYIGSPAHAGLSGEPSPKASPLLWEILNRNDPDLADLALSAMQGTGLEAKDIPVLASFLERSHSNRLSKETLVKLPLAEAQKMSAGQSGNFQLQRYLPEAITRTIRKDPQAAAPFIPSVEKLLDSRDEELRFGAACALAEHNGVDDPRISKELIAGLESQFDDSYPHPDTAGLRQLMAVETIDRVGPGAKSMAPALLKYARSAKDKLMSDLAFRAAGHIDPSLRDTVPEVDEAIKNDPYK